MNSEDIIAYLTAHPEFFEEQVDFLAQVRIPNPHGDRAVSLTERQIVALRSQIRGLEVHLSDMIRFARENDITAEKVHRLGVSLLGAEDLSSVMCFLYAHLSGSFNVPHVAVRLWGVGAGLVDDDAAELLPVPDDIKIFAGGIKRPYCGHATRQAAVEWLGDQAANIQSVAQIPLRENDGGACFGLMLLASEDIQRFYPDMGTLYLERIGDMAAASLLRVVG